MTGIPSRVKDFEQHEGYGEPLREHLNDVVYAVNKLEAAAEDRDDRDKNRPQYLIIVKITSAISGQSGRYNARIFQNTFVNKDATGTLVEGELGQLPTDDNCIAWFPPDIVSGSSSITAPCYVVAAAAGTNNDNKPVVIIMGSGGSIPTGQYVGTFLGVIAAQQIGYAYIFSINTV